LIIVFVVRIWVREETGGKFAVALGRQTLKSCSNLGEIRIGSAVIKMTGVLKLMIQRIMFAVIMVRLRLLGLVVDIQLWDKLQEIVRG